MNRAVRDILPLVEAWRIAGDLEVAPEHFPAGPHVRVRFVDGADSVHEEHVAVHFRLERTDGKAPQAGGILLHRHEPLAAVSLSGARGLGVQRAHGCRNQHLGGLGRLDAEGVGLSQYSSGHQSQQQSSAHLKMLPRRVRSGLRLSDWLSSAAGADGLCFLEGAFPPSRTL